MNHTKQKALLEHKFKKPLKELLQVTYNKWEGDGQSAAKELGLSESSFYYLFHRTRLEMRSIAVPLGFEVVIVKKVVEERKIV